jgi:hypothetical protein
LQLDARVALLGFDKGRQAAPKKPAFELLI